MENIVNTYLNSLGLSKLVGRFGEIKKFLSECKYQVNNVALTSICCDYTGIAMPNGGYCQGQINANSSMIKDGKIKHFDYKCKRGSQELLKVNTKYSKMQN